jgi:hypothetical protein
MSPISEMKAALASKKGLMLKENVLILLLWI